MLTGLCSLFVYCLFVVCLLFVALQIGLALSKHGLVSSLTRALLPNHLGAQTYYKYRNRFRLLLSGIVIGP